jgi:hypothetical protein
MARDVALAYKIVPLLLIGVVLILEIMGRKRNNGIQTVITGITVNC